MAKAPWLTIIGLGEDGLSGLSKASQEVLKGAAIVTGAARHLDLLPNLTAETRVWPIPFADGIEPLLALRGRSVVILASGDPFWFGAGSVLARHLERTEWQALPAPSVASHAAAHLGWPLEKTPVFGLHAAPLQRLRPALYAGARLLVLLRDGEAVTKLAAYMTDLGFGA
jgi:precorrin-6Y C5,15-methyltransferase (decarboxylating)